MSNKRMRTPRQDKRHKANTTFDRQPKWLEGIEKELGIESREKERPGYFVKRKGRKK
ncbi:hypothetical protein ACE8FZ_06700 [Peribacillus frigoritolerans]|uniref:hypothetical protein n=1 Tax=Peribacillus frigoritolerans TaxID=450367 RepID=UPI0035CF6FFD